MPSYTFDPGQGEAVPTSSLRGGEEKPTFTADQLNAAHQQEVAQNLGQKAAARGLQSHAPTDQDIDEGSYNPVLAAKEAQLQQLQQKLSMENDSCLLYTSDAADD